MKLCLPLVNCLVRITTIGCHLDSSENLFYIMIMIMIIIVLAKGSIYRMNNIGPKNTTALSTEAFSCLVIQSAMDYPGQKNDVLEGGP